MVEKNESSPLSPGPRFSLLKIMGPLLVSIAALVGLLFTYQTDPGSAPGQLGPFFWPKAILILLLVSCGIKSLEVLFSLPQAIGAGAGAPVRPEIHYSRLVMLVLLVLGVVLATEILGFPLANFFFLILFMYAAGIRKKFHIFSLSLLGTLALLFLFVKIVYLPLPKGYWIFEEFTISLYQILRFI
jgi:hypothetical protein